jgi:hypothetical protein
MFFIGELKQEVTADRDMPPVDWFETMQTTEQPDAVQKLIDRFGWLWVYRTWMRVIGSPPTILPMNEDIELVSQTILKMQSK